MSVFSSLAQTITNLLKTTDVAINMVGRVVNSGDNYLQTVERHAIDYNYESQLVSAKRREQLEDQFALLTPSQRKLIREGNLFEQLTESAAQPVKTTKSRTKTTKSTN